MNERYEEIIVELGSRSYPVRIGNGISTAIGAELNKIRAGNKIGIVTDENVEKLYLKPIVDSLESAGFDVTSLTIPPGEASKSLSVISDLYDTFLNNRFERNSTILSLGGGVVGDVAGFAAATLLRGVNYVQLPTTLLAQVDSSVGGKVGINHSKGKNLIGAFYQPKAVIIDTDFLLTLPQREIRCGMAEVIKYGLILDSEFTDFISDNFAALPDDQHNDILGRIIKRCVELKAEVVRVDEKENDYRRILNFGHTVGHGVEAIVPRGSITHGEAITFGMKAAVRISERLGLLNSDAAAKALRLLDSIPVHISVKELDVEKILDSMKSDKKVRDGEIHFVLLDKIGNTVIRSGINEKMIKESIEKTQQVMQ